MRDAISTFIFKGMLASHAVAELRSNGALRQPTHGSREHRDHDLLAAVPEVIRAQSLEMQRVYRMLFVFENLVRDFIASTLKETDGDDWFEKRASSDMKRKVDQRKQSEDKNQWHVGRNEAAIYYLDFGDLGLLIQNHWTEFKDFFPNQAWVSSRINEAERSRNVVAHTNVLAYDEIARLEMYLRDWVLQTG